MTQPLLEPTQVRPVTALDALRLADEGVREGQALARVWGTGFSPLDVHLDGGLHAGDLSLLAGAQGTGKTTLALQVARNVCLRGESAVVICYEHTPAQLLERLVVMEASLAVGPSAPSQEEVRRRLSRCGEDLLTSLQDLPGATEGLAAIEGYGSRLHLVPARGDVTGLDDVRELAQLAGEPTLVVVDYLQKVFAGDTVDEDVRVARIATSLKDLALELSCPVLAVTAVDRIGLDAHRIRARHLKGSVTLAYEADSIMVLQNKYDVVARQHLMYDLTAAQQHHNWLVLTVEKNRHGRDHVELEFRKRLSHGHIDPHGRVVEDQLVDERLHLEQG
ncbi:MAG: DnaB-like helicase C-terminal domain-containing protein [Actinomycetota bacterium]